MARKESAALTHSKTNKMEKIKVNRRIAIPNYYGPGRNIYEDQLGWQEDDKKEARSVVSKEIWDYFICLVGLNISFYYPGNDTFYGLHTEEYPYTFYKLPRCRECDQYIGYQRSGDTHDGGEIVYQTDDRRTIWNDVKIDGHSLEYVLNHSYIIRHWCPIKMGAG